MVQRVWCRWHALLQQGQVCHLVREGGKVGEWIGGGRFCEEQAERARPWDQVRGWGRERNGGVRRGVGAVSFGLLTCLGGKGRRGYGQESPGAL
jgi:hypothetical protein